MSQRWYQKASVQAALVTGGFLVVAAIVTKLPGWILLATPQYETSFQRVAGDEDGQTGRELQLQSDSRTDGTSTRLTSSLQEPARSESVGRPSATGASSTSRSLKLCIVVDVRNGDGLVLKGVTLRCGPKGTGFVLSSNSTLRFTRDLQDIATGVFPKRLLSFDQLRRVEFHDLDNAERVAVQKYEAASSDFFSREWRKATVSFVDGTVWREVYIYDKCRFEGTLEAGDLSALHPASLAFRRGEGECS